MFSLMVFDGDLTKSVMAKLSMNKSDYTLILCKILLSIHSSCSILLHHLSYLTMSVMDTNSDAIIERQTFFCLVFLHIMGALPRKIN